MPRNLSVIGLAFFLACGGRPGLSAGGPVQSPRTATVSATPQKAFDPIPATIAPGGTVTFAFGALPHNVYFDAVPGAPTDIPGVNVNVSETRTFAQAGTYTYRCRIHPGMKGSIVVSDTAVVISSGTSSHN
jgi:plastocyanin